jgi:PIN domain nuclease of toxin-antitoxin system
MAFRTMNVLLDTATWINGVKEPETLPTKALLILRNESNRFFLSDISLLEASTLVRKGRVDFGMDFAAWLGKALAENLEVVPISARVAAAENALPRTFHGDPADRIIASTAIAHQLTLLTPDFKIEFHRVCETIRYKWPKLLPTRNRPGTERRK